MPAALVDCSGRGMPSGYWGQCGAAEVEPHWGRTLGEVAGASCWTGSVCSAAPWRSATSWGRAGYQRGPERALSREPRAAHRVRMVPMMANLVGNGRRDRRLALGPAALECLKTKRTPDSANGSLC